MNYEPNQNETPERIDAELNFDNFNDGIPKTGHIWRQRGAYLVCTSCQRKHAHWIGPNRQFTGIDEDGNIILRKL